MVLPALSLIVKLRNHGDSCVVFLCLTLINFLLLHVLSPFFRVKPLNYFVAASIQIGDKAMFSVKSEHLKYPQPVPRGSPSCFTMPPPTDTAQQTALQNSVNSQLTETNVDTGKPAVDGDICKAAANEQTDTSLVKTQNSNELGTSRSSSGTDVDKNILKVAGSVTDVDKTLCGGASGEATGGETQGASKIENENDNICVTSSQSGTDIDCKGTVTVQNSGTNVDVVDTGNSHTIAKDLSASSAVDSAQDFDSGSGQLANSNVDDKTTNCNEAVGTSSNNVKTSKNLNGDGSGSSKNEVESKDLLIMNKSKFDEQCKQFEAVQSQTEVLQDRAVVLRSDLSRDVDLLSALHSDLCEASESIVKIADSFKPLLQRASSESAKEISGHVTRLLESRDRLNEQINLTEGLLKGGKKTIGVLQHLADSRKSKNQGKSKKDDNADSSDDYVTDDDDEDEDDDDDAGSHTGSIGSNASAKGTRSRPKVVSSRLLRHNRNQQPRLLTKKRPPPKPLEVGERICTEVTHTWTLVDVMWQVSHFSSMQKELIARQVHVVPCKRHKRFLGCLCSFNSLFWMGKRIPLINLTSLHYTPYVILEAVILIKYFISRKVLKTRP